MHKRIPLRGCEDLLFDYLGIQSGTEALIGNTEVNRSAPTGLGYQNEHQRPSGGTSERVYSLVEVSEYLVGSPAFKAGVRCDPP